MLFGELKLDKFLNMQVYFLDQESQNQHLNWIFKEKIYLSYLCRRNFGQILEQNRSKYPSWHERVPFASARSLSVRWRSTVAFYLAFGCVRWRFPFIVLSRYITTIDGNVWSQRNSKRLRMMIELGTGWERWTGGNDEQWTSADADGRSWTLVERI